MIATGLHRVRAVLSEPTIEAPGGLLHALLEPRYTTIAADLLHVWITIGLILALRPRRRRRRKGRKLRESA